MTFPFLKHGNFHRQVYWRVFEKKTQTFRSFVFSQVTTESTTQALVDQTLGLGVGWLVSGLHISEVTLVTVRARKARIHV